MKWRSASINGNDSPRRDVTPIALAAAFVGILTFAVSPLRAANDDPDPRVLHVERWLKAVLHHVPGADDAWVHEIGAWSGTELATFRIDAGVLVRLLRDPRLSTFQTTVNEALDCVPCIARGADAPQARQIQRPQQIRYA